MDEQLSFLVSAFAPPPIDAMYTRAKKKFGTYIDQDLTTENGIITLNRAHITIKRRFFAKADVTDQRIIEALKTVSFTPLPIVVSQATIFKTERLGNVLVGLIDKNEALATLHKDIFAVLRPFIKTTEDYELEHYHAHLSIVYNLPEDKAEQAQSYAQQHIIPFSYTLLDFHLLKNIPGVVRERTELHRYTATT